eukprot:5779773-Pleurochrysis_carterae.AAC.1
MSKRRALHSTSDPVNTEFPFRDAPFGVFRHLFSYLNVRDKANFLATVPDVLNEAEAGEIEVDEDLYTSALLVAAGSTDENHFSSFHRLLQRFHAQIENDANMLAGLLRVASTADLQLTLSP